MWLRENLDMKSALFNKKMFVWKICVYIYIYKRTYILYFLQWWFLGSDWRTAIYIQDRTSAHFVYKDTQYQTSLTLTVCCCITSKIDYCLRIAALPNYVGHV